MNDLVFMVILLGAVMLAVYLYAHKKGGIDKKNLRDWGVVLLIFVLALGASALKGAYADEMKWYAEIDWVKYTEFYVGIDYQLREFNPQCVANGIDDRINSNVGLTQNVLAYRGVELDLVFTHHSCAINDDLKLYDAIGPRLTYRVVW